MGDPSGAYSEYTENTKKHIAAKGENLTAAIKKFRRKTCDINCVFQARC